MILLLAGVPAVVLCGAAAVWLSVVWSADPLAHPASDVLPWPVACTSRGCITTRAWRQQDAARTTFNAALEHPPAAPAETLTTLVRQHLVAHAVVRSFVTPADARRYREEILNAKDAAALQHATTFTETEYDQLVILPFLQQEGLRQQRHIESAEELFAQLAHEHAVWVFVRGLQWDKEAGKVIPVP